MTTTIALIGALDTKGAEFAFVQAELRRRGHQTLVINTGVMGEPAFPPDITADQVAQAAGSDLATLRQQADRGKAIEVMAQGAAMIARQQYAAGQLDGILGMGGSAGTAIGTAAMRALPIGLPKLMVSTLASGDTAPYVDVSDLVMMPAVVDVAGVNRISARIFANAAGAMSGMVAAEMPPIAEKPLIAASMFGNTTQLVDQCRKLLEAQGYEVLVFHATGTGGKVMESLIEAGYINGVLDVTTTEWADELVGGVLSAGPTRLDAAAKRGIPQVIAPGCLDMVNFWARNTVPEKFANRQFYVWNPNVTLMRTTPAENATLGRILAEKANQSAAPVAFYLPQRGVSVLDSPGGEFWQPAANEALFTAIKQQVRADIPVYEVDNNINDAAFAEAVVNQLLEFLK
ncbi:MAG: Tm-1-like ATP-binding domain-containing protein [Caldilineaceae bacterium]|nr:Tm-1-like ATP-binding domain-containing protein [Caldilineaceae bacterium]